MIQPINFLENKKEKTTNFINFKRFYYFIGIFIIFIFLLIFDYYKLNNNINYVNNKIDENNLLLENYNINTSNSYSNNDLVEYDKYLENKKDIENKIINIITYINNNSSSEIYSDQLTFNNNQLEIRGKSTSEELIYTWINDNKLLELKELNYENNIYSFIIVGDFNES